MAARASRYGRHVDDTEALARLPKVHAVALHLEELGAHHALIADCLGIEIEGVGPLLTLARAKRDRLVGDDRSGPPDSKEGGP